MSEKPKSYIAQITIEDGFCSRKVILESDHLKIDANHKEINRRLANRNADLKLANEKLIAALKLIINDCSKPLGSLAGSFIADEFIDQARVTLKEIGVE